MALLKEDGSLDIERINNLPLEEYMDEMGSLTQEQIEEYLDKLPTSETKGPVVPIMANETIEEFMARTGAVDADKFLAEMRERIFKRAADSGDSFAMFKIGFRYLYGEGVEQSYEEALRWLHKSAELGCPHAMFHLGECYYLGMGVPKDRQKAKMYYEQAAIYDLQGAIDALHYDIHYAYQGDSHTLEYNEKVDRIEEGEDFDSLFGDSVDEMIW